MMRIALVSPYSWTYPGGVTQAHRGARRALHRRRPSRPGAGALRPARPVRRGAAPRRAARSRCDAPDYLVSLGRTVGFKANGAVSNLSITPHGVATLQRELRTGGYDVVHIHEPVAPLAGWVATDWTRLPLVGTFHSYTENRVSNGIANLLGARRVLNRLHVRIAVSEAAAWTGAALLRRPLPGDPQRRPRRSRASRRRRPRAPPGDALRIVFVGQAVERKGLPLLLRAFEALREHIPTELTVIGPTRRGARAADARRPRRARARQGRRRSASARSSSAPTCCAPRRCAGRASAWC